MKRLIHFTAPNPRPSRVPDSTAVTGSTPSVESAQREAEMTAIKARVGGANGKVKGIITQIDAIQEKVRTLGVKLEERMTGYVRQKTGNSSIDLSNADTAQTSVNTWLESQQVGNIDALREFDRGLELIDLRVQFRKGLQTDLEGMGSGLNDETKREIGQALEHQLDLKEGQVDTAGRMTLLDFKRSLEITHEVRKFANLLNGCKSSPAATSLATAKMIPAHSIAYPQTSSQNFNAFEMFTKQENGKDIVFCIDTQGMVQKMNPYKQQAFSSSVWEVVYRPASGDRAEQRDASFPASEFPTADILRHRVDASQISAGDRQTMLQNFARERTIISAASRGFEGMSASELARFEGMLGAKWQEYQRAHTAAYRTTPGIQSGNYPIRQTLDHYNSAQFNTDLQTAVRSTPTMTTNPSARPGSTTETTNTVPEGQESIGPRNEILVWPSNGNLPWGNAAIDSSARIARLSLPQGLQGRDILSVIIDGQPVPLDDSSVGVYFSSGLLNQLRLRKKPANARNIKVVFNDRYANGTSRRQHIDLNFTNSEALTTANVEQFTALDPSTMRRGVITTGAYGNESPALAAFENRIPGVRRNSSGNYDQLVEISSPTAQSNGTINGQPATFIVSGQYIRLAERGPRGQQSLNPGDRVRVFLRVTDRRDPNNTRTENLVRSFEIQDKPEIPERDTQLASPAEADRKVHLREVRGNTIFENIDIASLHEKSANDIQRRVLVKGTTTVHPFLEIHRGKIRVKRGAPTADMKTQNPIEFDLEATREDSRRRRVMTYSFENNELTPASIPDIPDQTLNIGTITTTSTRPVTLGQLPDMHRGISHRTVVDVPVYNPPLTPAQSVRYEIVRGPDGKDYFRVTGNDHHTKTISHPRTITLQVASYSIDSTHRFKTEEVVITLGNPEALTGNEYLNLAGGDRHNNVPRMRINKPGERATSGHESIGVRLASELPPSTRITSLQVHQGSQTGREFTHPTNFRSGIIFENGEFKLREGCTLPSGQLWVNARVERPGTPAQQQWILIENTGQTESLTPTAADIAFITPRTVTTSLNTSASGTPGRINFAQLGPQRSAVRSRTLTRARIGQTTYTGVRFDQRNGIVYLDNNSSVPNGTLTLEFNVQMQGSMTTTPLTTTLTINQTTPASSTTTPTTTPSQTTSSRPRGITGVAMPEARSGNRQEVHNVNVRNSMYRLWDAQASFDEMVGNLEGFHVGGNVPRFVVATIDARSGRFAVHNNGFTTLLTTTGSRIKIHGGPPGNEQNMEFPSSDAGLKLAMSYAAALNKLCDQTINTLGLDQLSDFDDQGKAGEFFEFDSGDVEVNDNTGTTDVVDPDLWDPPARMEGATRMGQFITLANAVMRDYIGKTGERGRPRTAPMHQAPLYHDIDRNGTIVNGRDFNFQLTHMDDDYIYSYSADRKNWLQVPPGSSGTANISIPRNVIGTGGFTTTPYTQVITLMSTPRNPSSNNRRPKIVYLEIPVVEPYVMLTLSNNRFKLEAQSLSDTNKIHSLTSTIEAKNGGFYPGYNLSVASERDSLGRVVIKNGNLNFAYLTANSDGSVDCDFAQVGDDDKFGFRQTTGGGDFVFFEE